MDSDERSSWKMLVSILIIFGCMCAGELILKWPNAEGAAVGLVVGIIIAATI